MAVESHKLASPAAIRKLALAGLDRRKWYQRAYREITAVCVRENWDIIEFTRTLAILSPRVSVRRNVRMALTYHGAGKHFDNTVRAVRRSLEIYQDSGKIGGFKVSAFAAALLGDSSAVCLDSWMAKALVLGEDNPDSRFFRRKATREGACKLIGKVGRQLNISPRECQAAVWSGMFRSVGQTPIWFPIIEEYRRWLAYDRSFPLSGYIPNSPDDIASETEASVDGVPF